MIFVRDKMNKNDWNQITSSEMLNYVNDNQLKTIGNIRMLAHKLCFTESYRIKIFDIYLSEYMCAVIFEIKNMKTNQYIRKMRGQVFIDKNGNVYFYDKDNQKQEITTSLFPSVIKE